MLSLLTALLLAPLIEARIAPLVIVIGASLLGGLLSLTRLRPLVIFSCAGVGLLYAAICLTPIIKLIAPNFIADDKYSAAIKSDVIVVLSAEWPLAYKVKSQGLERLIHGIRLMEGGAAETLVVTDVPKFRGNLFKDRDIFLGKLKSRTIQVGPVENTYEEALAVYNLAKEQKWSRIILVTSPIHSRRAKAIFTEQLVGMDIISSPATPREFDLEILDSNYERLKVARLICYEIAAWAKNILLRRL